MQLIVLVGDSEAERASFASQHSTWAIASREAVSRALFPHGLLDGAQEALQQAFAALVVELLASQVSDVCIDTPNLARAERRQWIELAQLAGRRAVACVMPAMGSDGTRSDTDADPIASSPFEPPTAEEGFAEVLYITLEHRRPERRKRRTATSPALPLFSRTTP